MHNNHRRMTAYVIAAALFAATTLTPVAKAHAEPVTITALIVFLLKTATIAGGIGGGISGVHALKQMQEKKREKRPPRAMRACRDRHGKSFWVDGAVPCPNY